MIQKLEINPITGQLDLIGIDEVKWGEIQGNINDQTDLIDLVTNPNLIEVFTLADLPTPELGIITLPNEGKLYSFFAMVDLLGNTIRFGNNVFRAISQEVAGLSNGIVEILETCTISDFRFDNVEMIINAPLGAYDWNRVNFYDCPNVIDVQAADNIIMETLGFINSENFKISGTINSLALSPNCIFRSVINPTATFFRVESTAVINRRLRIENSVFQTSFVGQKDIEFISGATIPDERFRLSNILFQGNGIALTGINGNSSKALFRNNEGGNVINSTRFGRMYINNNTTPTTIAASNTATKVVGTFTPNTNNQRFSFDVANNLLTCISPINAMYNLQATLAISGSANKKIGAYLCVCRVGNAINPTVDKLNSSENYIPSATGGRADNLTLIDSIDLSNGDRVYLAIENETDTTQLICEFANLIVQTNTI